jgi:hypothetical protein
MYRLVITDERFEDGIADFVLMLHFDNIRLNVYTWAMPG